MLTGAFKLDSIEIPPFLREVGVAPAARGGYFVDELEATMRHPEHKIRRARHGRRAPYFSMARATAQDNSMSYEARGMLAYLLSKPDDWTILVSDLQMDGCGRDKTYRILRELINAGYIRDREKYRDENGRWVWTDYELYEVPIHREPVPEKPYTDEPYTENQEIKHNRDKQNRDKHKKMSPTATDRAREESPGSTTTDQTDETAPMTPAPHSTGETGSTQGEPSGLAESVAHSQTPLTTRDTMQPVETGNTNGEPVDGMPELTLEMRESHWRKHMAVAGDSMYQAIADVLDMHGPLNGVYGQLLEGRTVNAKGRPTRFAEYVPDAELVGPYNFVDMPVTPGELRAWARWWKSRHDEDLTIVQKPDKLVSEILARRHALVDEIRRAELCKPKCVVLDGREIWFGETM